MRSRQLPRSSAGTLNDDPYRAIIGEGNALALARRRTHTTRGLPRRRTLQLASGRWRTRYLRKAGDDRRGTAAVLRAMNDLIAKGPHTGSCHRAVHRARLGPRSFVPICNCLAQPCKPGPLLGAVGTSCGRARRDGSSTRVIQAIRAAPLSQRVWPVESCDHRRTDGSHGRHGCRGMRQVIDGRIR